MEAKIGLKLTVAFLFHQGKLLILIKVILKYVDLLKTNFPKLRSFS